jgi:hypothetical protein
MPEEKPCLRQGLKMRSVFLKIVEIWWDRSAFSKKSTLITEKSLLFIEKSVQKSKKLNTGLRSQETPVG